jgi:hypothetical protein
MRRLRWSGSFGSSKIRPGARTRHSATEWRQLVAMAVMHFQDEPLAFEPAQIVLISGLSRRLLETLMAEVN